MNLWKYFFLVTVNSICEGVSHLEIQQERYNDSSWVDKDDGMCCFPVSLLLMSLTERHIPLMYLSYV